MIGFWLVLEMYTQVTKKDANGFNGFEGYASYRLLDPRFYSVACVISGSRLPEKTIDVMLSHEYTDHMHVMLLRKSTRMSRYTRQEYDACDKATQHYTNELLDIDNCWHYSNLVLFFPCAWIFCSYQRTLVHFFSKQASTINWNIARSIQLV